MHIYAAVLLGVVALTPAFVRSEAPDTLWRRANSSVTADIENTRSRNYTHIVVGCGLAGLTVAVRLSENVNNTVLCIEAGNDTRKDSLIAPLPSYNQAAGNAAYDWSYETVVQNLTKSSKSIRAGKGLGGSSSINGGLWSRGTKEQYDAIGALGNSGWTSADLLNWMKKAEHFYAPTENQTSHGANYIPSQHGTTGPVDVAFTPGLFTGPQQQGFAAAAVHALGLTLLPDLATGDNVTGVGLVPLTIQPSQGLSIARESSATAYLSPVEFSQQNLVVLTGWRGVRLTWSTVNGTADGVYVQQKDNGPLVKLNSTRETIIAAGAIGSPLFLQRSGVGEGAQLKSLNISVQVDLPGVGKNLQEQTQNMVAGSSNVSYGGVGPSAALAFPSLSQLMSNASAVRASLNTSTRQWAEDAVRAGAAVNADGLLAQYALQIKAIFDFNAPVFEMFFIAESSFGLMGTSAWQLLPFSRGYVRASSASAFSKPVIDPRYFAAPIDIDITVAGLRGARKVFQDPVLRSFFTGEFTPGTNGGFGGVADNSDHGTYAAWRDWALRGYSSVAHPIGTTSMMPRSMGGVVDENFKVYGTQNVRVVDASVLPMQISAHLSSTLYGVAEKAAATIQGS